MIPIIAIAPIAEFDNCCTARLHFIGALHHRSAATQCTGAEIPRRSMIALPSH
ncbi:MAG: hypothetical protein AB7G13_31735 [Lautropia sp.]